MSKFNAVRLINVNYNDNAIKISDETFQFNGKSTLLSLRNGGGKSVLVQMMIAPFVHKRYRNAKDRPFESYFTTNKPSFILVEWQLDHGAGYVMTGVMVRRRQEISSESGDELEMVQFISEYQHSCAQDIHNLPVIEKKKKEIVLKNFSACRQLFDSYKKDPKVSFFYYDMNNSAQSRQYFDKLMEYQINYKEWENIIKEINRQESGLSNLFADCKDEKGLVEKWLLRSVENKLNKENDRMKEFQNITEKYISQYKDNQSKIQRRDIISQFKEESTFILETAGSFALAEEELEAQQNRIGVFLWQLETARTGAKEKWGQLDAQKGQTEEEIDSLQYGQVSKAVYEAAEAERYCLAEQEIVQLERDSLEQECGQVRQSLNLLDMARQQAELEDQRKECSQYGQQLELLNQKEQDSLQERVHLGYRLHMYYAGERKRSQEQVEQENSQLSQLLERIQAEEEKAEDCRNTILKHSTAIGSLEAKIQEYDTKEEHYNKRYEPNFVRNILGEYEPAALEIQKQEYEKEQEQRKRDYLNLKKEAEKGNWKQKKEERDYEDAKQAKLKKEAELKEAQAVCEKYNQELERRRTLLRYFGLDEDALFDMDQILLAAEKKLSEIELAKRKLEKEDDELQKDYQRLTQGKILELSEEFEQLLEDAGILYVYGMEWLKKNQYTEKENRELVKKHPFLPYALLISRRDMKKLLEQKKPPYTSSPIPIMVREQLDSDGTAGGQPVLDFPDVSFYILFNEHLLNEKKLKQMVAEIDAKLVKKKEQIQLRQKEYQSFFEKKEQLRAQEVTKERREQALELVNQISGSIQQLDEAVLRHKEEIRHLAKELEDIQKQIQENQKKQLDGERRLEELQELIKAYQSYLQNKNQLENENRELNRARDREQLAKNTCGKLQEQARQQEISLEHLKRVEEELSEKLACYEQYQKPPEEETDSAEMTTDSAEKPETVKAKIEEMESRYQAITSKLSLRLQEIERLLQNAREKLGKIERELKRRQKKYHLKDGEWLQTDYDQMAEEHFEQMLEKKTLMHERKKAQWNEADKKTALASQRLEQQKKILIEKCHRSDPMPKEEIQPVDFTAEIEKREYRCQELEKQQQFEQKRIVWYEENLTALAEFSEYMPKDEGQLWEMMRQDVEAEQEAELEESLKAGGNSKIEGNLESERNSENEQNPKSDGNSKNKENPESDGNPKNGENPENDGNSKNEENPEAEGNLEADADIKVGRVQPITAEKIQELAKQRHALEVIGVQQAKIEQLQGKELRTKKGMLVRDYNYCKENRQKQKEQLTRQLNQMVRRESFAEDFYRKPIEAMIALVDDAGQVIRQLQTTLQSYESLMEKIQVDIDMVEKEKERIVELLGTYILEVHKNLGQIDHNSTITVRGRTLRMLRIILPQWEENEGVYEKRISDFMEETTKKGIYILEQNENVQEYIGLRMTTKNLYDAAVGISNVQIRMYKIEEQRELPITWSQVARNSGGEGFLSAFIILSSLLYYMRHDDSDLFAERNEGKVLVMDNPFAQTNASHLLKPLMDMAKKTNTQLICLSGLGGDSIYNRFDNIYVLNLVAANMRNGMHYLKAEHLRGEEPETLLTSQIEVVQQEELIF